MNMNIQEIDLKIIKDKKVYIYGASYVGEMIGREMQKRGFTNFDFIDRDSKNKVLGKKVFSPQHLCDETNVNIVIGSSKYMIEIYNDIKALKLEGATIYTASDLFASYTKDASNHVYGTNFEFLSYRMSMLKLNQYLNNGWNHKHLDVIITEKCTLKCEACASLMPLYKTPRNCDGDIIFQAMDNLFASGCYLEELVLIGGETLLNQKLLADFYRRYKGNPHIGMMAIFTNGTVLPQDFLLEELKDANDFWVYFSNYGELSRNQEKAVQLFEEKGIVSTVMQEEQLSNENAGIWIDYGYPKHYKHTEEECQKMYNRCYDRKNCTAMVNGKIYICPRIAHGVNVGLIPSKLRRNYVDTLHDVDNLRERCIKFFEDTRYPEACEYCDRENGRMVKRAKQIER